MIKRVFNLYKNNFIPIFIFTIIYSFINVYFMYKLSPYMAKTDIMSAFSTSFYDVGVIIIAQEILRIIFLVGFLGLILRALKADEVNIKTFFTFFNYQRVTKIIKLDLFVIIIAIAGMMLLVIPGVIWFTLVIFSYFIINGNPNIKILNAINISIVISKGYRLKIFFIILIYGVFSLFGTIGIYFSLIFDVIIIPFFYLSLAVLLSDACKNFENDKRFEEIKF